MGSSAPNPAPAAEEENDDDVEDPELAGTDEEMEDIVKDTGFISTQR